MNPLIKFARRCFAFKKYDAIAFTEAGKMLTKYPGETQTTVIDKPLEGLLGCLANCKILSIKYQAMVRKVKIQKLEIECKGEYDSDFFMGKKLQPKDGRNTYSFISVKTKVYSNHPDKKKLEEAVKKGDEYCPVLNTLKLAGIKINTEFQYL